MKLKILPPTLRINNHYLALDIKSEVKLNKDELVSAIWYGCLRLYGEIETSSFNLWLMKFYDITDTSEISDNYYNGNNNYESNSYENSNYENSSYENSNENSSYENNIPENNNNEDDNKNTQNNDSYYYHFKAVLRCQRGYEDKVRGSLALLTKYNHKKIAISTIGISGTIASSMEKFIN